MEDSTLDPHLQSALDNEVPILDILDKELKSLLAYSEEQLVIADSKQKFSGNETDALEMRYWEGICEAYSHMHSLAHKLSLAAKDKNR